jgi:hypothetical protein
VAARAFGGIVLASFDGGEVRPVPGIEEGELPIQWRADGRALCVYRPTRLPVEVFEVDVAGGQRRRLMQLDLPGITGVDGSVVVTLTPDARSYVYSFFRPLAELYLIEGLD